MNKSLQKLYFHFSKNIMHVCISRIVFVHMCERERKGGRKGGRGRKRKKKTLGNRIIGYRLLFLHFYPHKFYPHR